MTGMIPASKAGSHGRWGDGDGYGLPGSIRVTAPEEEKKQTQKKQNEI